MKPVATLSMLGVTDFNRSLDFYKALGFPTDAQHDDPVAFFQLHNIILGLYDKQSLAEDATVPNDGKGFTGITIAHNLGSEKEVDDLFAEVQNIGAKIVKSPQKTDGAELHTWDY